MQTPVESPSESGIAPWFGFIARYSPWLVPLVYLACAIAFVSDLMRANTLAYGIFYVPLVATAVFHKGRNGPWMVTILAIVMVAIGSFFPTVDPDLPDLIGNRVLSILAILATAAFVLHARATQERLAAQTRRAETAERIKTEVFRKLSEEMRTPLHALLGVMNLMIASSRPDQADALGRVRNGGKQLLATIDNLIELTQIDERALATQPVDVSAIARAAADESHLLADEYGVALEFMSGDPATLALGDPWAVRRILNNLIAGAVQLARRGSTVRIVVRHVGGRVIATIGDDSPGLHALSAGSDSAALTLNERLAAAMDGLLVTDGADISLSLPKA